MSKILRGKLGATKPIHARRMLLLIRLSRYETYKRPAEIGGTDHSEHSADLTALYRLGHLLRRQWEGGEAYRRPSYEYALSAKGKAYIS